MSAAAFYLKRYLDARAALDAKNVECAKAHKALVATYAPGGGVLPGHSEADALYRKLNGETYYDSIKLGYMAMEALDNANPRT